MPANELLLNDYRHRALRMPTEVDEEERTRQMLSLSRVKDMRSSKPRTALVIGAGGQDGVLISLWLTQMGYEVVGAVHSDQARARLERLVPSCQVIPGDVRDALAISSAIEGTCPAEIYYLAGVTTVKAAEQDPSEARRVMVDGLRVVANTVFQHGLNTRLIAAGSALMYEGSHDFPQTERTVAKPLSCYAQLKWEAFQFMQQLRSNGVFAATAILFNHESPLRDSRFVTQKIAAAVARISLGIQEEIHVSGLRARRDWGWAPDYVKSMWKMTQVDEAEDLIIATGEQHSVEDFIRVSLACVDIGDFADRVKTDDLDLRRVDSIGLCGDYSRARLLLDHKPTKDLSGIAHEMIQAEIRRIATAGKFEWRPSF